jgi:hypothetical protein
MNCAECKELLVGYIEGLLEDSQKQAVQSHLQTCPPCRAELAQITTLHDRLIANGKTLAQRNLENKVLDRILQEQSLRLKKARQTDRQLQLWRIIMKSQITKFAAAAAIIIVAGLLITLLGTGKTLYALEQTIQASHSVRYLHIKDFKEGMEEPKEFWLEFDEQGSVKNIRAHMPEWDSPSDGAKVTVWQEGKAKIWFKKKKSLLTIKEERFADEMSKVVQLFDPKLVLQRFYEMEKSGLVEIEIDEPPKKSEPITVTSTNSSEVQELGYKVDRTVIFIDQGTKLVTAIEHYRLAQNADYELLGWTEFYDYNQRIEPAMFVLDDIPSDVMRIDWTTQEIGLEQGDLSDEEIAVKAVREFYEALIAKDYAKAGKIYCGVPAAKMQERWQNINVLRIVSISEPIPHPHPRVGGFQVHCEIEIEKDGVKSILKPYGPAVRPVHGQSYRWNIHGGVK